VHPVLLGLMIVMVFVQKQNNMTTDEDAATE